MLLNVLFHAQPAASCFEPLFESYFVMAYYSLPTPLTLIEPRLRKNIDKTLLLAVLALMALSLLTIHNATMTQGWGQVARQAFYFLVGLA